MKYSEIKKNIYSYYKHFDFIDIDNIQDVNDHITSEDLSKSYFENTIDEFYVTLAMCTYMIENDLYDNYFFETYEELLEEYNNSKNIMDIEENDEIKNDIDNLNDYLLKDKSKEQYYDNLSHIYEEELNIEEDK
jgi:hypothetical protein